MEALWSYPTRWLLFVSGITSAALYVFHVVRPIKSHLLRVLACAPIFLLNVALQLAFLPMRLEIIEAVLAFGACLWLGNSRLAAFCFGRGTLADPAIATSFPAFLIALYFPLRVSPQNRDTGSTREGEKSPDSSAGYEEESDSPYKQTSFNREQSSSHRYSSDHTSTAAGSLKNRTKTSTVTALENVVAAVVKTGILYLLVHLYVQIRSRPEFAAIHTPCQGIALFLLISGVMNVLAAAVAVLSPHLKVEPHFDAPFLSSSLQDFWARRWNQTIGCCLRDSVYHPVVDLFAVGRRETVARVEIPVPGTLETTVVENRRRLLSPSFSDEGVVYHSRSTPAGKGKPPLHTPVKGSFHPPSPEALLAPLLAAMRESPERDLQGKPQAPCQLKRSHSSSSIPPLSLLPAPPPKPRPSQTARLAATLATFFVSGIMHEYMFFLLCGAVTGDMVLFFSLHGVLTSLEAVLRRRVRRLVPWLKIPQAVSVPLTLSVLLVTGHRWFLGPFEQAGVVDRLCLQLMGLFKMTAAA